MPHRLVTFAITLLVSVVGVCAFWLADAEACSLATHAKLEIVDEEPEEPPPETPEVELENISRGHGPTSDGCFSQSSTSCDDIGSVTLKIENADPEIGYELEATEGSPSEPLWITDPPIHAFEDGTIVVTWNDEAKDNQESLDYDIAVTAVDRWGQESEDSDTVEVEHPGGLFRAGFPGALVPILLFLVGVGALRAGAVRT